jgi:micrococcal nuclease
MVFLEIMIALGFHYATITKVIDGDSLNVHVPRWVNYTPIGDVELRVYGIDTPETNRGRAKCPQEIQKGKKAHAYVQSLLKPGDQIRFTPVSKDKYFRIDAHVTLPDGRDLGQLLLDQGLAVRYFGGTKPNWCA